MKFLLEFGLGSSNSERSGLLFEAWKPVIVKRNRGVYIIDLKREIFKPILKLQIFTAHGIMESTWLISIERALKSGFKTGFYGAWRNGVPLRIWTQSSNSSNSERSPFWGMKTSLHDGSLERDLLTGFKTRFYGHGIMKFLLEFGLGVQTQKEWSPFWSVKTSVCQKRYGSPFDWSREREICKPV
jgi:hypothetical protein